MLAPSPLLTEREVIAQARRRFARAYRFTPGVYDGRTRAWRSARHAQYRLALELHEAAVQAAFMDPTARRELFRHVTRAAA